MEKFDKPTIETEMRALREGIKNKYTAYHSLDRDRFPDFEYNTSRINYEPLRESFEEEFYVVRGLDRTNNTIHIPSTNTLALIFCDDKYTPGKKILDTCRSYAEGKSKVAVNHAAPTTTQSKTVTSSTTGRIRLICGILLAGFTIYAAINQLYSKNKLRTKTPAKGLVMYRPYHGQTVPRLLTVEGKVSNADTVWLIVHPVSWDRDYVPPMGWSKYYVQPPIKVNDDGTWKGQIYIGSVDQGSIGVRSQLRAFVNPDEKYKVLEDYERDVFASWPKAQLSTEAVEVVRGAETK